MSRDVTRAPTILLVDDEALILTSLRALLVLETDWEVLACDDPLEAVKILETREIDVLVADYLMPRMNGIQLLARAEELQPSTVGLMLTGHADKHSAIDTLNDIGSFQYIEKPWDNQALLQTLHSAVEIASHRKSLARLHGNPNVIPGGKARALLNPSETHKRRPALLLVDDEEIVGISVRAFLKLETDFDVVCLTDPRNAVEELKRHEFDVVIADYLMPNMNGLQCLRQALDLQPLAVRILLTAHSDKHSAIQAINEVPLYYYLEKPWDNAHLLLVINSAVDEYAMRKRLHAHSVGTRFWLQCGRLSWGGGGGALPSVKVFLCHAKENKKEVRGLYRTLLDVGAQPWLDDEDVLPGQDWEYEIQRAMSECDAILVCLSRSSVAKRGFVQTEIRKAIELAGKQPEGCIFIIPVRFEECEIPSQLSRWQSVDLYCEGANERLFRALELRRRLAARYASRPGVR